MKILFLDSPAFAKQDMIDAFNECSIQCDLFFHEDYNIRQSNAYSAAFDDAVSKDNYAFVFSFNYYPILSTCCQRHNIKYVSYVYDSPLVALYSCTLIHPCNYVFIFDKVTYLIFKNAGIDTVYYLPLAANVKRLSSMICPNNLKETLSADVSFVGSLYNEEHNLFERLEGISEYTTGYLDAIMKCQEKIYGQFFLEELLHPSILEDMQKAVPYTPLPDGTESAAYVYANYFLARKITSNERINLLGKASESFSLKLFSHKPSPLLPHAHFVGAVDYYDVMPLIFKNSRINLNISLKSIYSGIPLRCMDILGAGGFLLSNFQADFFDFFVPGEDYVYYESEEDFIRKIDYYLKHEQERTQIANNALGKMKEQHTFTHRVEHMLSIL